MAYIDSTIPMGIRPPVQLDIGGAMQTGLNIAKTRQDIITSQAALPGVQGTAQSLATKGSQDARDFSIQQQIGANSHLWQTMDKNGNPQTDYAAQGDFLRSIGAGDKVQAINQDALKTENAVISNTTNSQDLNTKVQATQQQASQVIAGEDLADEQNGLTHGQIAINHARRLKATFEANPLLENSSNIPQEYSSEWAKSTRKGVITEQQQITNKQNQEQINISQQSANTSYQSMLQGGATVAQAQGALKQSSDNEFANSSFFNTGAALGKDIIGSGIGKTIELYTANVLNNPKYAPYVAAVARYNQEYGTTFDGHEAGMSQLLLEGGAKHHVNGQGSLNTYQNTLNPNMTSVPQNPIPAQNTAMPGQGGYTPVTDANFKQGGPKLNLPPTEANIKTKGLGLTRNGEIKSSGKTPIIRSQAEYDKLPVGSHYADSNGNLHTKK